PAAGTREAAARSHSLPPPRPTPLGGLGLVARRRAGLERHRRGDPGAPRDGHPRRTDPPGTRLHPPPPQPRRRLRAHSRPRLRLAVDGLGDPGLPRRREAGAARSLRIPPPDAPQRRQLPLLRPLRDDSRLGHLAGATGPWPDALPTLRP